MSPAHRTPPPLLPRSHTDTHVVLTVLPGPQPFSFLSRQTRPEGKRSPLPQAAHVSLSVQPLPCFLCCGLSPSVLPPPQPCPTPQPFGCSSRVTLSPAARCDHSPTPASSRALWTAQVCPTGRCLMLSPPSHACAVFLSVTRE